MYGTLFLRTTIGDRAAIWKIRFLIYVFVGSHYTHTIKNGVGKKSKNCRVDAEDTRCVVYVIHNTLGYSAVYYHIQQKRRTI